MISREALIEFQQLYLQRYGEKLTDQQGQEYGTRLIGLIKAVYGQNLPKFVDIEARKDDN